MSAGLSAADWLVLLGHFMLLSLLSVGGAITTVPEMHRFLVDDRRWLGDAPFNASIAIAQAAPGPNVLFVALLGWNVGLQAGGLPQAALGMLLAMGGVLAPSSVVVCLATRWLQRHHERRGVRAFRLGMAPIVIALLVATGWTLATGNRHDRQDWPLWLLAAASAGVVWRTRLHMLWLLGAGALLGWFGLV